MSSLIFGKNAVLLAVISNSECMALALMLVVNPNFSSSSFDSFSGVFCSFYEYLKLGMCIISSNFFCISLTILDFFLALSLANSMLPLS